MAAPALIPTAPFDERIAQGYVPEEDYLCTSYRPDCDYVEGRVQQRTVGEYEHSRVQVSRSRYRLPDVMVLRRSQKVNRIVREAPLICIEVLSPEDTWAKIRERLDEYLAMGVEHVWCFEPESREVRRYTA